jgi:hypothetical protein
MKASSVHEIKKELNQKTPAELAELTLRLARFKKENKELLTYLLFESENESGYVKSVMEEMDEKFAEIPSSHNIYFKLKMIRKILRMLNKYIRYSSIESTEVELRIHFCKSIRKLRIPQGKSQALDNLYHNCLGKCFTILEKMHEDLRSDYEDELKKLMPSLD